MYIYVYTVKRQLYSNRIEFSNNFERCVKTQKREALVWYVSKTVGLEGKWKSLPTPMQHTATDYNTQNRH